MPEFLIEMLNKQYGESLTNKIIEGYKEKRKVTFRVNTLKARVEDIKQELLDNNIVFEDVPWSKEAFIINNVSEKEIRNLKVYENGKIYMQNLSSMIPPIVLEPKEGTDILDMAAAPGGKTTQIAALTNNKAHITACEMNKIRAEKLKYNIQKQGATSVFVMEEDSRKLNDFFSFDQILLDSPCSGSGTLNFYDNNMLKNFTQILIQKSQKLQISLLEKALKILKNGQEMVYSTCSILSCENEDIINKVLQNGKYEIVPIQFNGMEDIPLLPTKTKGTICVMPTKEYEGFFVAKIKKIK